MALEEENEQVELKELPSIGLSKFFSGSMWSYSCSKTQCRLRCPGLTGEQPSLSMVSPCHLLSCPTGRGLQAGRWQRPYWLALGHPGHSAGGVRLKACPQQAQSGLETWDSAPSPRTLSGHSLPVTESHTQMGKPKVQAQNSCELTRMGGVRERDQPTEWGGCNKEGMFTDGEVNMEMWCCSRSAVLLYRSCRWICRQSHTGKCPGNSGKNDLRLTNITEEERSTKLFRQFLHTVPGSPQLAPELFWCTTPIYTITFILLHGEKRCMVFTHRPARELSVAVLCQPGQLVLHPPERQETTFIPTPRSRDAAWNSLIHLPVLWKALQQF